VTRRPILPIGTFDSLRYGASRLSRGSIVRKGCVGILKLVSPMYRIAEDVAEIRPLDDPSLSFIPVNSMVMEDVYWFGLQGYEGILIDYWAGLSERSQSVLEIGGNIGLYTVVGGRTCRGTYTVVEPLPQNLRVLNANLERNAVKGVEVVAGAVIPEEQARMVMLNIPDEGRETPTGAHLIGADVMARGSKSVIDVQGFPMASLARGRDLIKIDAEGMEADLLQAIAAELRTSRPSLVIEVLPESARLAALLRDIAEAAGYTIWVVPAWATDEAVAVPAATFAANVPGQYHSKDVILTRIPLNELPHPFSR
jgi:FkbM family methyltransferase